MYGYIDIRMYGYVHVEIYRCRSIDMVMDISIKPGRLSRPGPLFGTRCLEVHGVERNRDQRYIYIYAYMFIFVYVYISLCKCIHLYLYIHKTYTGTCFAQCVVRQV